MQTLAIPRNHRTLLTVLTLHGLMLWTLSTGALRVVVPKALPAAPMLTEIIVAMLPPEPAPAQKTPPARPTATPIPLLEPRDQPEAISMPSTASAIPDVATAQATVPAAPSVTPPRPDSQEIVQPSSDADYLHNPKPPYPPMSKRLREQGTVIVRALIGDDGVALQAEISQSSGFDRLDRAALATALRWRYVPGKRAGVPTSMWFNLPFTFVLE
jgi:protein TonB